MFVVHSASPSENWPGVTGEFQYPLLQCCPRGAQENPVKLNQGAFVLLPAGKPRTGYYYVLGMYIRAQQRPGSNDPRLNVIDTPSTVSTDSAISINA